MPDQTLQQLSDVFCDVLENMAFMFGDPADGEDLPASVASCIEATIGYAGASAGELTLLTPKDVAGELAANLLGLEEGDDDADALSRDALGELMNVTLGRLLTAVAGDQAVFDLSPPRVSEAGPERWQQFLGTPGTVGFVVEDSPVLLRFRQCV